MPAGAMASILSSLWRRLHLRHAFYFASENSCVVVVHHSLLLMVYTLQMSGLSDRNVRYVKDDENNTQLVDEISKGVSSTLFDMWLTDGRNITYHRESSCLLSEIHPLEMTF